MVFFWDVTGPSDEEIHLTVPTCVNDVRASQLVWKQTHHVASREHTVTVCYITSDTLTAPSGIGHHEYY